MIGSTELTYGDLLASEGQQFITEQNLIVNAKGNIIVSLNPIEITNVPKQSLEPEDGSLEEEEQPRKTIFETTKEDEEIKIPFNLNFVARSSEGHLDQKYFLNLVQFIQHRAS